MKYIIKKIIALIITLLVISLLTFVAFSLIPGDAALGKLSLDATPEAIEALRHQMGLDQPVLVRYVKWLLAALQGDFGMSLKYSNMTVMGLIQSRLPVTIILAVMSLIIIVVVSMPLGLISAKYSKKTSRYRDQSGDTGNHGHPFFFPGNHSDLCLWPGPAAFYGRRLYCTGQGSGGLS